MTQLDEVRQVDSRHHAGADEADPQLSRGHGADDARPRPTARGERRRPRVARPGDSWCGGLGSPVATGGAERQPTIALMASRSSPEPGLMAPLRATDAGSS